MITLTNQKFRINRIKLIKELEKYPLFNTKIIKDIIKKDRKYAKLVLYRLKKDGLIIKIEKNAYTLYNDSVLIAGNLVWPCYLSCWTAIRYYNLTDLNDEGGFYLNMSFSRKTINFINFSPIASPDGELEKHGIHYHFFEDKEMAQIFDKKLTLISQEIEFIKKPVELGLLESLFQKPK